ncbi:unnamed protein product [Plutella xylostella]|uniref:(diamondback moth) hypothetical protein n=1 Tax=Plutella xylostella TaxID=51655 RepID=A0A8S4ET44_PLUXY|nr:unnamed protein product [Plutella xylostella]
MLKVAVVLCVVMCVIVEARPKWQILPPVPGYVPVYIRTGDTPLEEINPDLAEAFHALPAGRSAGKLLEAASDISEQFEEPSPSSFPAHPETPQTPDEPEEA